MREACQPPSVEMEGSSRASPVTRPIGPVSSGGVAQIENLTVAALRKAFRRLKKDTGHFERLLVRDPVDFVDFQVQLTERLGALQAELTSGKYVPDKPV